MPSSDPRLAFAANLGDPQAVLARNDAALEERIETLERNRPTVQVGNGVPVTSPRDGTLYVDFTAMRLYVRVGGAWKYTVLS